MHSHLPRRFPRTASLTMNPPLQMWSHLKSVNLYPVIKSCRYVALLLSFILIYICMYNLHEPIFVYLHSVFKFWLCIASSIHLLRKFGLIKRHVFVWSIFVFERFFCRPPTSPESLVWCKSRRAPRGELQRGTPPTWIHSLYLYSYSFFICICIFTHTRFCIWRKHPKGSCSTELLRPGHQFGLS